MYLTIFVKIPVSIRKKRKTNNLEIRTSTLVLTRSYAGKYSEKNVSFVIELSRPDDDVFQIYRYNYQVGDWNPHLEVTGFDRRTQGEIKRLNGPSERNRAMNKYLKHEVRILKGVVR